MGFFFFFFFFEEPFLPFFLPVEEAGLAIVPVFGRELLLLPDRAGAGDALAMRLLLLLRAEDAAERPVFASESLIATTAVRRMPAAAAAAVAARHQAEEMFQGIAPRAGPQ